jgi:predicted ester cyclase
MKRILNTNVMMVNVEVNGQNIELDARQSLVVENTAIVNAPSGVFVVQDLISESSNVLCG